MCTLGVSRNSVHAHPCGIQPEAASNQSRWLTEIAHISCISEMTVTVATTRTPAGRRMGHIQPTTYEFQNHREDSVAAAATDSEKDASTSRPNRTAAAATSSQNGAATPHPSGSAGPVSYAVHKRIRHGVGNLSAGLDSDGWRRR